MPTKFEGFRVQKIFTFHNRKFIQSTLSSPQRQNHTCGYGEAVCLYYLKFHFSFKISGTSKVSFLLLFQKICSFTILAGFPTITAFSFWYNADNTEPAPTTHPSAISVPFNILTPNPIHTYRPIRIFLSGLILFPCELLVS